MSKRFWWVAAGVVVAVAAVLSAFASSSPDGLEWTAEHLGFDGAAVDSAVASGPFADYSVAGTGQAFVSNGLAGLIGVAVVAGVTLGLTRVLRRAR